MAKKSGGSFSSAYDKVKKKRKGVHAKTKNSSHKSGKHYNKAYRGQGR